MILHRCFPWDASARPREPGGPLWFPRLWQGAGRHDNPDLYGCLYASKTERAAVAEQLARFRGLPLARRMLRQGTRPLALARIDLRDDASLVDLDDPGVLVRESLRPSVVATRRRAETQEYARRLFGVHADAAGLLWWSTLESSWANATVFDRAEPSLYVENQRELTVFDPVVREAAEFLGLG